MASTTIGSTRVVALLSRSTQVELDCISVMVCLPGRATSAEGLATSACGFCLRVVKGEAGTLKAIDEIDRGSGDQRNTRWVDEDGEPTALAGEVGRLGILHQTHLILVAGTTASQHRKTKPCDWG